MMRTSTRLLLGLIVFLTLFSLWLVWPQRPTNYLPAFIPWPSNQGFFFRLGDFVLERHGMLLGIDLGGGTHLVFQAELDTREQAARREAVEGLRLIIERRINAMGLTNPQIQRVGEDRISVILPGIRDVEAAKQLIGKTAQLDFRELVLDEQGQQTFAIAKAIGREGQEKDLTGAYFRPTARVVTNPQSGLPEVAFEFDDEGGVLFEQITTRLLKKPLGIFLDGELISAPIVQAVLRNRGVITGLTPGEARTLAIQLNSGALPVPVHVIQERSVDAVLGADAIRKSIVAGEIGLGIVILFMILIYRLPGLLASAALLVYILLLLAIFKLLQVELNLPSIAAFILSIGMAVDANVLIFERLKEELRLGRTLGAAIETGFERAWSAIRDSNATTFLTCLVLFWFGSQFGTSAVAGFAVTLALGVATSMFSAIVVTRTFLRVLIGTGLGQRPMLFGVEGVVPAGGTP